MVKVEKHDDRYKRNNAENNDGFIKTVSFPAVPGHVGEQADNTCEK